MPFCIDLYSAVQVNAKRHNGVALIGASTDLRPTDEL